MPLGSWKIAEKRSADGYRQRTQAVLINYLDREKPKLLKEARKQGRGEGRPDDRREPPTPAAAGEKSRPKPPDVVAYLKQTSLAAWPQGKTADALRLEQLHALREKELAKPVLARDYGSLVRAYLREWRGPQPATEHVENRYAGKVIK